MRSGSRKLHVRAGYLLLLVLIAGLALSALELGINLLTGAGLPDWPIAYYLAAPLVLGSLYVSVELLWEPIGQVLVDADKVTDPGWKRGLRAILLILIGCGFVAVALLLQERGWL